MQLHNKTILITGGSSGIGLQLANVLQKKGNTVIICGRNAERLEAARADNPALIPYTCDVADPDACRAMMTWVEEEHPSLSVLINNAAISHMADFMDDEAILEKAELEMAINFMGPLRLAKLAYPMLKKNGPATIVNVTTGLVYVPRVVYPIYPATKAALHSFTQTLRVQLAGSPVDVIEVLFPAVDTPWHGGNAPAISISVDQAVDEMVAGLEKGKQEIRVGAVKLLNVLSRVAPAFAMRKLNQI